MATVTSHKKASFEGISLPSPSPSQSQVTLRRQRRKDRDSFSFYRNMLLNDEDHELYRYNPKNNKQPCPPVTSDYELELGRSNLLPTKCKNYNKSRRPSGRGTGGSGGNEDEDDGDSNQLSREPPDFESITTYKEYLDHYVTDKQLFYFENDEVARFVVSLGYSTPELLSEKAFNKLMAQIQLERLEKRRDNIHISWEIGSSIKCPLMRALAEREVPNRNGSLTTLIYLRTTNLKGEEVSGWIDYRLRLDSDQKLWYEYFTSKRRLIPRTSDLCFYNWTTFAIRFNSSENYLVTIDIKHGLQFMNKDDRKTITVNPYKHPGDNTSLIQINGTKYMHCMIYDHFPRIKA